MDSGMTQQRHNYRTESVAQSAAEGEATEETAELGPVVHAEPETRKAAVLGARVARLIIVYHIYL